MRKTALLSGVAGLFLMTAPAFAQDSTAPQTPPAPVEEPAPQQPQTLTLTPGATVTGADGEVLGQLVGARNTATGQEITVRGADGQVRGVPTAGIRQEGGSVVVDWSSSQFMAAPVIEAEPADPAEPTPPATPATPAVPATPATPAEPGEPGEGATPAVPAEPAQPAEPAEPADPTAPPVDQPPPPGEAMRPDHSNHGQDKPKPDEAPAADPGA